MAVEIISRSICTTVVVELVFKLAIPSLALQSDALSTALWSPSSFLHVFIIAQDKALS